MDVKYIPADWEKMRSGLNSLIGKGFGKGMIDELKDISSNFEEAESHISKYDSDGVISYTHTDQKKAFQGLLEDFEVLYRFTGKVGDIVDRTIDQPFYEDIDAFVTEVRELSISNYKTKNRIGVTDIVYLPESYGSIEVAKKEVGLDDVFSGDSFYGKQMALEYEAWKDLNVSEDTKDITQEDYQMAALNTRAFGYESIRDTQENKEFWVNIGALAVIIGVTVLAVVIPPVGVPLVLGLGAVYGSLEAGSAITGKDWISGRELGTGERWFRGVLAPLDIIPGAMAIKKFSGVARTASLGRNLGKQGLKATTPSSIKRMNDLVVTAGQQVPARLKSAGAVVKESIKKVPAQLEKVAVEVGKVVDETITNTANLFRNMNSDSVLATTGGTFKKSTNTPVDKNTIKETLGKIKGVNISDKGVNEAREIKSLNQAHAWGEKNYSEWLNSLSIKEKQAVIDYTGDDYWNINSYLRGNSNSLHNIDPNKISEIQSALTKAKLPEDIVVYRGTDMNAIENVLKFDKYGEIMNIDGIVGKVIKDDAFMSTAILKESSFDNKRVSWVINVPQGSNGAYVAKVSKYPNEAEILFNSGQEMIIKEVTLEANGKINLVLDLIKK